MSRRPVIYPSVNLNAVSTAATITGSAIIIAQLPGVSFDCSWTGTTHGTLKVQVSNTVKLAPDGTALVAGNWFDLPSTAYMDTLPAPGGSPGTGFINVNPNVMAYAARLVFTRTDGTGALTATVCSKVV